MRIVVVSPPRSGNHWTKCLLAQIYGLQERGGEVAPDVNPQTIRGENAAAAFPDGSVSHMHARFSRRLVEAIEALPAHIVTPVRDPYDVFLSYYHWTQKRTDKEDMLTRRGQDRPRTRMLGRALDDPEVLAYLAENFDDNMRRGLGWLRSGRTIPIRYEALHADPVGTLQRVTDQIQPVDRAAIERAIAACDLETYRQNRPGLAHTLRTGKVGSSKQELGEAHLRIFRERWAELIAALGYPVR